MMQFVETIRVENGVPQHLAAHSERLRKTAALHFGVDLHISVDDIQVPENLKENLLKCRILYSDSIEKFEFSVYEKRQIETLKVLHDNDIDYTYKSSDREDLNRLFQQRNSADEIIIVKNGWVTDSSFSNLLFEDEEGVLFTPSTFLLNGIQRKRLLEKKRVQESPISEADILRYSKIHLINAMLSPGDLVVEINKVFF